MKYLVTILFAGICLVSCSNNEQDLENNNSDPLIKQMKFDGSQIGGIPINSSEINFKFEYDSNNKLTKKVGGYIDIAAGSGYSKRFTDKVYTSLIYTDNKVTVENFYDSDIYTVAKNTAYYTLNSSNLIEEKEVPSMIAMNFKKEFYKYSNGKLTEIITTFPNRKYYPDDVTSYILTFSEKFYYDINGNLIKTERFEQHNGKNEGEEIVRTFENYDISFNPYKKLQLLEEYFYRSLSRNNFRKYTETSYYYENVSKKESTWDFNYDKKGNIVIN